MVEVKTGLSLYTVELGNPDGAPMLVLHGGWGPADNEWHRLDILNEEIRSKFRIIYFHQRGWGRSKIEEVTGTDTSTGIDANIADCEVLRQHFGIDKWAVVYGGSNGATLGLAYAAKYFGSTVSGLVLRGLWLIRERIWTTTMGTVKTARESIILRSGADSSGMLVTRHELIWKDWKNLKIPG